MLDALRSGGILSDVIGCHFHLIRSRLVSSTETFVCKILSVCCKYAEFCECKSLLVAAGEESRWFMEIFFQQTPQCSQLSLQGRAGKTSFCCLMQEREHAQEEEFLWAIYRSCPDFTTCYK